MSAALLTVPPFSAMLDRVRYPGGKSGAGVYQTIINLMPPHRVYIEPFLGGGAIMRLKRPAAANIGLDLDPAVIAGWRSRTDETDDGSRINLVPSSDLAISAATAGIGDERSRLGVSGDDRVSPVLTVEYSGGGAPAFLADPDDEVPAQWRFQVGDGIGFLRSYRFTGEELVYCDPPYLHSTRSRTDLYRYEMTDRQHRALLRVVKRLPCKVMLSGYWSRLYTDQLQGWNSATFQAMTRAGKPATEHLWFNFPPPVALHDYRFLGADFRERERIKRKKLRWVNRLRSMPMLERQALLAALATTGVSGEVSSCGTGRLGTCGASDSVASYVTEI